MLSTKLIVVAVLAISSQMTKHKVLTCWMPDGHVIRTGLDAGFNRDISALFNLLSEHAVNSASRCFYGPPPQEQILQAAKNGDLKQLVSVSESAKTSLEVSKVPGQTPRLAHGKEDVAPTILEVTNEQGETPLHLAAARGDAAMVRLLLSKGASVNKGDLKGVTPLMKAAIAGDVETVDELLKNGADAEAQALNGSTALMFAASAGHEAVVGRLIEEGCSLDTSKDDGYTALMLAARNGRIEAARVLIGSGASINLVKKDGWSALMLAAHNGRHSIVKLLIEHKANVQLKQGEGHDAKTLALHNGYRAIAQSLNLVLLQEEKLEFKASRQQEFKQRLLSVLATLSTDEKARFSSQLLSMASALPGGTYQEFCRDIAIVNDELTASCRNDDDRYQTSSLKLPCAELIDSIDGHLICTTHEARTLRIIPIGPYQASCSKCQVTRGVLSCTCAKYKYSLLEKLSASLKLPCKGRIENRDGELKCE